MRARISAIILPFILLMILTACGQAAKEQSPAKEEAAQGEARHGGRPEAAEAEPRKETLKGRLPDGYPADLPIYAQAQIEQSTKKGEAYTVALRSGDAMGVVWAFYRKAMAGNKWFEGSGDFTQGEGPHQFLKGGNEAAVDLYSQGNETRIEIIVAPVASFPRAE